MQKEPTAAAVECKHDCKDKECCGPACCKRHLSLVSQLESSQRVAETATSAVECKHNCRDKLVCGHQCCKRHLARQGSLDLRKLQPAVNLQLTAQSARRSAANKPTSGSDGKAPSAAVLQVQGRAVSTATSVRHSPQAAPLYHFFVYDIESTGDFVQPVGAPFQ